MPPKPDKNNSGHGGDQPGAYQEPAVRFQGFRR